VDAVSALARIPRKLVVCLVTASAVVLTIAPAGLAQPAISKAEAEKQLDALGDKMAVATEQYNNAREDLKASRARQAVLAGQLNQVKLKLSGYQDQLGAFAALSYRGGSIDKTAVLLNSGSPQDMLDQMSYLEYLGSRRQGQLSALLDAKKQISSAQAKVDHEVANQVRQENALRTRRAAVLADLQKLEALRKKLGLGNSDSGVTGPPPVYDGPAAGRARIVVQFAYAQIGKPYEWGAAGPRTFDCSGLTMRAWGRVGVSMPHSASKQYRAFRKVPRSQLQPGDIVLFFKDLHHDGLYIGNGQMIHAPRTGKDIQIASIDSKYMPYMGAVRPS
jgi:cell wall-associated NlpC family hydrolase